MEKSKLRRCAKQVSFVARRKRDLPLRSIAKHHETQRDRRVEVRGDFFQRLSAALSPRAHGFVARDAQVAA